MLGRSPDVQAWRQFGVSAVIHESEIQCTVAIEHGTAVFGAEIEASISIRTAYGPGLEVSRSNELGNPARIAAAAARRRRDDGRSRLRADRQRQDRPHVRAAVLLNMDR